MIVNMGVSRMVHVVFGMFDLVKMHDWLRAEVISLRRPSRARESKHIRP